MYKRFNKYMDDSAECLDVFDNACNAMVNCGYILADTKIANILKSIASSSILYDTLTPLCKSFDFAKTFAEFETETETDQRTSLTPPADKNELICLTLALLYRFDIRELDLHIFLNKYFPSSDGINESYRNFATEFVLPFKSALLERCAAYH